MKQTCSTCISGTHTNNLHGFILCNGKDAHDPTHSCNKWDEKPTKEEVTEIFGRKQ